MWPTLFILFSFFVSFSYAANPTTPSSHVLHSRARIDLAPFVTCSRTERRVIVRVLREAARWVRLAIDTAEDRQVEQPDNEQYQAWKRVRREVFSEYFGNPRPRIRREIGEIFESLKWELDRSPGGRHQNDDDGGNVVRLESTIG